MGPVLTSQLRGVCHARGVSFRRADPSDAPRACLTPRQRTERPTGQRGRSDQVSCGFLWAGRVSRVGKSTASDDLAATMARCLHANRQRFATDCASIERRLAKRPRLILCRRDEHIHRLRACADLPVSITFMHAVPWLEKQVRRGCSAADHRAGSWPAGHPAAGGSGAPRSCSLLR